MEIVIISSLVLAVILLHRSVPALIHRLHVRQQFRKFISKETFYHSVVSRHLKYYNRLNLEEHLGIVPMCRGGNRASRLVGRVKLGLERDVPR
jgi:hypothetical protein